jgi:Flp pilus assembly protein TadD
MAGHPKAEAFKAEGNKYFKNGDYKNAITKYREATSINPNDPAYWSNMAACYEKLTEYDEMEDAARNCIKADKSFVKGYFRLATALKAKNDLEGCIKALESGLAVDSTNADLKKMKKDLTELQRGETVSKYISKCEEQMANGQIAEAYKSLELASRLDAGNPDIERMMAKVKPKYDRMEQQRRANLSSDEVYKERGDDAFKNAQFEGKWILLCVCVGEMDGEGCVCVCVCMYGGNKIVQGELVILPLT